MLLSLNDNISFNITLNDFKFRYVVDLEQSFSTNLISDRSLIKDYNNYLIKINFNFHNS